MGMSAVGGAAVVGERGHLLPHALAGAFRAADFFVLAHDKLFEIVSALFAYKFKYRHCVSP
jgi:hypothetical protein